MKFFLLITIITWNFASIVHADEDVEFEKIDQPAIEMVTTGQQNFSNIYFKATGPPYETNYVYSPLSLYMTLSMTAYGSKLETRTKLFEFLGFSKKYSRHLRSGYRTLIDDLAKYQDVNLIVKNRFYYFPNKYGPKRKYSTAIDSIFGYDNDNLAPHFHTYHPERVVLEWTRCMGEYPDKDIAGLTLIGLDPVLMIASSFYFKGSWATQFNSAHTVDHPFWNKGIDPVNVPTMYAFEKIRYGQLPQVGSAFIELPYKTGDTDHTVSMFVILPNRLDGFDPLIKNMDKISLNDLCNNAEEKRVLLYLPKFEIQVWGTPDTDLKLMGLAEVFSSKANFSGISELAAIVPSGIAHEAKLDVHEYGTGPVTEMKNDGPTKPPVWPSIEKYPDMVTFNAYHPFVAIVATTGKIRVNLLTAYVNELYKKPTSYKE